MTRRPIPRLLGAFAATAVVLLAGAGAWHAAAGPQTVTVQGRAVAVERGLRCPTCQGLSIADSPSPIAAGMRQQVERQLAGGANPAQVRGYFTDRYGDWILLAPPRHGIGWLVWAAPALLILGGLLLLRRTRRRRRPSPDCATAEPAELAAAAAFAADPSPPADMAEPVAAALTDLRAARIDADLDPAADSAVAAAVARLAAALRDHPISAPAAAPSANPARRTDLAEAPEASRPVRRRSARYALPAAAVVFAGLLAITLTRGIAERPPGAVITGSFATTPPGVNRAPRGTDQLAALKHATQVHPNDAQIWLAYATDLDTDGQLADAELNYRKALMLDPSSVPARQQLAWLLTRGGSPSEALTLLKPLARARPDDPEVVLLLGLAQRGADQPQAAATLRRYLRLAPSAPAVPLVKTLLNQAP